MKKLLSLCEKYLYDENVVSWSERILGMYGLWPNNRKDIQFSIYVIYILVFVWLECMTLLQNLHDIEETLRNCTLTIPTMLIVLKTVMFRLNINLVLPILDAVKKNVKEGLYETQEEKQTVVWYNIAATLFTASSITSLFFVPTLFYIKPIVDCLLSGYDNCTLPYELAQQIQNVYAITDLRAYAIFCVILLPISAMTTVGATGADSLLVTLTFYLCAQLSILGNRIRNVNVEPQRHYQEMQTLVERHIELLRLASNLAEAFSTLMFIQTMGLIFSLCIVAYQLLTTSENGQDVNTIHFIIYSCAVVLLAFCYCFLGECLITESSEIQTAYYSSNWYELPGELARSYMICIARSQKPAYLTAGKFYVFSLETFAIIMKASMAYLSVLRTVT